MTGSVAGEKNIQGAYQGRQVAADYIDRRFTSELMRLLHERQVASVQAVIDRLQPSRILEIAPGPGRITRDIRPTGKLVCLEYNQGMIECGRHACNGKAIWVRGNGFRLPFSNGQFDFAYSFRFIRHFQKADRCRLYAEIRRALQPGGWFILDAVNERVSRPLRQQNPAAYPIYDELYTPKSLKDELAQNGFEVVSLKSVQKMFTWQYRSQVLLGPRSAFLNRLLIRGLERVPVRDGLEWIVTCRRE